MKRLAPISLFLSIALMTYTQRANAVGKEMMTSATYGVLAGTIVGAATLAFTDSPGDKIHRVARGASLGLYAGILLGFYVTYGVGGEEDYDEEDLVQRIEPSKFALVPIMSERGLEGATAVWNIKSY